MCGASCTIDLTNLKVHVNPNPALPDPDPNASLVANLYLDLSVTLAYTAPPLNMAVESWRKRLCLSRKHIRRAPGEEMRRAGKYVGVGRAQSPVWRPWGVNKCDPLVVKAPSSVGERLLWQ